MEKSYLVAEQVAFKLLQYVEEGQDLSFLVSKNQIFWAKAEASLNKPLSPTVKLIQGVFDRFIDLSFFHLRNRIYTTGAYSEMDRGMILVTAKRAHEKIMPVDHQIALDNYQFVELSQDWVIVESQHLIESGLPVPEKFKSLEEASDWVKTLAASVGRGDVLHDHNRSIGAVLLDENLRTLSSFHNSNYKNKTFHAEVLCLQRAFLQGKIRIPQKLKLLVTLKPCRMCAGMFAQLGNIEDLEVLYMQEDPGAFARGSLLEKLGRMRRL